MSNKIAFSDEELTAYLDGESDYARMDQINKALSQDSELRARIATLSLSHSTIKAAFDELLPIAPETSFDVSVDSSLGSRRLSVMKFSSVAAVLALVTVSFVLGWGGGHRSWSPSVANTWHEYVAAYQALYITSTLAHIERSEKDMSRELKRVSLALGKDIQLKDVNSHAALDYKRAQVLGYKGKPLIQLAFLSMLETPIALCIIRLDGASDSEVQISDMEGMSAASWEKGGYAYLLIGGTDALLIDEMAADFQRYL